MGHRYDYLIDREDDSAPARVVRMVGEGKRVLDIGAGPGSIARSLRDGSNCRVTALEIEDDAIQKLFPYCERVYRTDLNDPHWMESLEGEARFDVVVAADVLEHLYDPWSALKRMKELISADGCIIVSIPHAGHNGVLGCLLDGDFEYRDSGLLDRDHIRFFGIKNIQSAFRDAGLSIVAAEFVIRFPEDTDLAGNWDRIPVSTRVALAGNKFGLVYQVVVKAVPYSGENPGISLLDLRVEGQIETASVLPRAETRGEYQPPVSAASDPSARDKVKLLAFFLNQFHPIPENNRWWGKGFTEWSNVTKAEPLFDGHYQPHLPSDLGFYDLRLREVRHEQIALAKQYGIDGFCYYYYWFSGTRILNRPLDDALADPESDMPFCLCWANENWTKRWDGGDRQILIEQKYLPSDDLDFIKTLIPFFQDSRYIRLDGAPFLIVYQPQHLPNSRKTLETWRKYCRQAGIGDIHVCAALTNDNEDYARFGFDSGVQFPPHGHECESRNHLFDFYAPFHGRVAEYRELAESYMDRRYENANVFRTVVPSWDQTARVGSRSFMTLNGTPANYEYWLNESIRRTVQDFPGRERFVFVNAWNEWAEGCHLEPDRRFQRGFLEATFRAKNNISEKKSFEDVGLPVHSGPLTGIHAAKNELRQELAIEKQRVVGLERELLVERQRLTEVFKDVSAKRQQVKLAELKLATAAPRQRSEKLSAHKSEHVEDSLDLPLREVLKVMQARIMNRSSYFGIQALRSPMDQWIYQELLFETKPDVIIEIGNYCGAGALALAHICDVLGKGRIIGVDSMHDKIPEIVRSHPRITLVEGEACASFSKVRDLLHQDDKVLIIEDSLHTYEHTLSVLRTYSGLVPPGGYFIVEDGICHHGVDAGPNPGPYEAITSFMENNRDFEIDRSRESFLITWNPKGYLKRVR